MYEDNKYELLHVFNKYDERATITIIDACKEDERFLESMKDFIYSFNYKGSWSEPCYSDIAEFIADYILGDLFGCFNTFGYKAATRVLENVDFMIVAKNVLETIDR